jgi:hypothetical protein
MRFLASGFFHESVSTKPQFFILLGCFNFFLICGDIHSSSCTTRVVDTRGNLKKSSFRKVLNILFCEYLRDWKIWMTQMLFLVAWGKMIHEKPEAKISWLRPSKWEVLYRSRPRDKNPAYQCWALGWEGGKVPKTSGPPLFSIDSSTCL